MERRTPLHLAVQDGNASVVGLLLREGAPINAVDADRRSALHLAADRRSATLVARLLREGAAVNLRDSEGRRALHLAAASCDAGEAISALLNAGAMVDALDQEGRAPLHLAAANCGDWRTYAALAQAEPDRAIEDAEEQTPQAIARDADRDPVVMRVLRAGLQARSGAVALPPRDVGSECEVNDLGLLLGPADDAFAQRETRSARWTEKDCLSSDRSANWGDTHEDLYGFELFADAEVEIDLRSQADAYLGLLDPSGDVLRTDDDGGTAPGDARITAQLPAGRYWVAATTFSSQATGEYQLAVRVGY